MLAVFRLTGTKTGNNMTTSDHNVKEINNNASLVEGWLKSSDYLKDADFVILFL